MNVLLSWLAWEVGYDYKQVVPPVWTFDDASDHEFLLVGNGYLGKLFPRLVADDLSKSLEMAVLSTINPVPKEKADATAWLARSLSLGRTLRIGASTMLSSGPRTFTVGGFAYANSIGLKRRNPEACIELSSKRIAWRQHTIEQLRSKLEEALLDEVPRAVKQVCRDVGVCERVIRDRFPDLKRKLQDRHTAWLATERSRKQLQLEFAVKKAVRRVQDRGEYPSANNILAESNSLKFAGWERLQSAINKARKA